MWQNLTTVLIRNKIIVPCMTVELSSWYSAPKWCMMTSRIGMYLNWNRSRRNTTSTAHTHTQLLHLYVSSCSGVGTRQRYSRCGGTHDAKVRPGRTQHLSQSSSPATNQSPLQFHSTAASWKMSTSQSFFSAGPFQELCMVDCPLPPYPNYCLHIYTHQITLNSFACTKFLLSPNICILMIWRTSQIFYYYYTICSNTTIITQNAKILLLSQNMLKYYYFHCTARQIHKDRRGRARRRTWWATICQGTGLWGVESYKQFAQWLDSETLHV